MRKGILVSLLFVSSLMAEVATILPYIGTIEYENDATASAKKDGNIIGMYTSVGDLSYLVALDYAHTDLAYKDSNISNLEQDDVTITYAKYYEYFMVKGGFHYINTNDTDLGDANVFIGAVGGYHWDGYDKYSYGVEGYYSNYQDGHDENNLAEEINIIQLTPYFAFSKVITVSG